jgi:hypothetical protein
VPDVRVSLRPAQLRVTVSAVRPGWRLPRARLQMSGNQVAGMCLSRFPVYCRILLLTAHVLGTVCYYRSSYTFLTNPAASVLGQSGCWVLR